MLAPAHGAKNNLVVLLEEHVLHHELLVDLASLAEVHELSLIVASLVPVVDVVRILNERARALDQHKLQNGVLVYYSINEIFVVYSLYLTRGGNLIAANSVPGKGVKVEKLICGSLLLWGHVAGPLGFLSMSLLLLLGHALVLSLREELDRLHIYLFVALLLDFFLNNWLSRWLNLGWGLLRLLRRAI